LKIFLIFHQKNTNFKYVLFTTTLLI